MAAKATNQSDTATIISCVSGLFSILYGTLRQVHPAGSPFMIPVANSKNHKRSSVDKRFLLTSDLRERQIAEQVLSELSIIYHISNESHECAISVGEHFATRYVSVSRELLSESKMKDFERLTEWYSKQISLVLSSYPLEFRYRLRDIFAQFRNEIAYSHPYAIETIQIHLNKMLTN
jgi:hypothetical protein